MAIYSAIHLSYIIYFCSPVPFWDEWDHFVLFSQNLSRQTSWAGIFHQYWLPDSVHRVPVLKALFMVFHQLPAPSKWLMALTLILMLTLFTVLWRWYLRSENKTREDAIFFAALFLFFSSWNQGEVFFMGMAIAWFIANLTFALAYRAITRNHAVLAWLPLGVSALTQGTWLFAAGALLVHYGREILGSTSKRERTQFLFLGLAFSAVAALVYWLTHFVLEEPIAARLTFGKFVGFILTVWGSPFMTMGFYVSLLAGIFLLCFLVWMVLSKVRRKRLEMPIYIAYGLIASVIITLGRGAGWKFPDTVGYRYSTFMVLTWVFIFLSIWKMLPKGSRGRKVLIAWLFVSTTICDYKQFLRQWENADSYTYAGRILLRLVDHPELQPTAAEVPILLTVFGDIESLRKIAVASPAAVERIRKDICGSPNPQCP